MLWATKSRANWRLSRYNEGSIKKGGSHDPSRGGVTKEETWYCSPFSTFQHPTPPLKSVGVLQRFQGGGVQKDLDGSLITSETEILWKSWKLSSWAHGSFEDFVFSSLKDWAHQWTQNHVDRHWVIFHIEYQQELCCAILQYSRGWVWVLQFFQKSFHPKSSWLYRIGDSPPLSLWPLR